MAAHDNLNPRQFMSVKRMGRLASANLGGQGRTDTWARGYRQAGGRDESPLDKSVAKSGVRKAIHVDTSGTPQVSDGMHRYAAAVRAGQAQVPVKFDGPPGDNMQRATNAAAHYTPPSR